MLSIEQADSEITSRTADLDALSAALVELDNHAGLQHIRRYPPTGATEHRWISAQGALTQMWEGLRRMTSILDAAQAVRARGTRWDEAKATELNRILHGRPLAVTPDGTATLTPAARSALGGAVEWVGLDDTAAQIRAAYPAVSEFLTAVDETTVRIAAGLAPCIRRLDALGAPIPQEITDLLTISATDPLTFTPLSVDERIGSIVRSVDARSAELTEDVALRSNWTEALAETSQRIDMVRGALTRAAHARHRAESAVVTSPLPVPDDPESGLRERLRALTQPDPAELRALRQLVADAGRRARENEQLAQGLLERRSELQGRLAAYQAKAARLGIGENKDLMASSAVAAQLLASAPCDLRAATLAVTDYQRAIAQKRVAP